ncbi:NAD(P)-dependent oxidoreductase [Prevotella sp. lc2012]|uniref:NAD-dependent epimerase/dehydratase family protein n=1 Tax=Prevotella sp. lc2012 TaxID=1761886 RepID=UPI00089AB246|nr:NAD(P)-dependent oxidoreductase [Prevotella sp. lc2012]SEE06465.1 dTDP-glucose 4,6-dehydratase [Prevotella sp. lc2012]
MKSLYVLSGASGMTGSELVRQILEAEKDSRIIGFDNFFASSIETIKDYLDDSRFVFNEYDINNLSQMRIIEDEVAREKTSFDRTVYINCAAVVHTEHFYEVEHTWETNVISMKSFLEQAIRVKADIYINCSTSEVYSMHSWNENGGVRESDYLMMSTAEHSQRTSYACGKLMTEFFMKDAVDKGKIKGCSIRFANVYSKHERFAKHIIPHIINELLGKGSVTLLENSKKNRRAFLHNIDSCRSVMALINSEKALDGTVYNVATDEEITIIDLTYKIAEKMGMHKPEIIFSGYRSSDPERRFLNTEKIRTRTDWTPIITLDKGLEMCVASIEK